MVTTDVQISEEQLEELMEGGSINLEPEHSSRDIDIRPPKSACDHDWGYSDRKLGLQVKSGSLVVMVNRVCSKCTASETASVTAAISNMAFD